MNTDPDFGFVLPHMVYWGWLAIMPLILIAWLVAFAYERPPIDEVAFRGLQALAVVIGIIISWLSYFRWQTPVGAIQDKLGAESWVRYASLDVDNAVADQVRRDKERLVEYRALTRGR